MSFWPWTRRNREVELDEEIQSHLTMAARDRVAAGQSPGEAAFAARREFGNVAQVKEVTRETWGWIRIERLVQDVRIALRGFRRTPVFAVTAVLILGLGIGMASAAFTVFQQILIKRLPMHDQRQLIELSGVAPGTAKEVPFTLDQAKRFGQETRTLQQVASFAHWGAPPSAVIDGDRLLTLRRAVVTEDFFDVLGAAPFLGRLFQAGDQTDYGPLYGPRRTNAEALVAVISYDTWRRYFNGDPAVVGRRVRLPEVLWNPTVVGVAPPGLDFPRGVQMWTPNAYGGDDLVGRLALGSTVAAARAELTAFIRNDPTFIKQGLAEHVDGRAEPVEHIVVGDVKPALIAVTVAVGLLLLLACGNIANMLLLRAAGRARELAVRRALGASKGDIARQLLMESVLLAAGGGVLGVLLSKSLLALLVRMAPFGLPRLDMVRFAPTPVMVTAGLALAAVVLFGMLSGVGVTRLDVTRQLRADPRSGTEGRRLRRVRQLLVASQIALALVLLAGAGLVMRSFARLSGLDMGFPTIHLSVVGLAMPWDTWVAQCGGMPLATDTGGQERLGRCVDGRDYQTHDQLAQAFGALPGVEAVSSIAGRPFLGPNVFKTKLAAAEQSAAQAAANPWVGYEWVGPGYFDALRLRALKGRLLTTADREDSPGVAVITEGIAGLLWPGADPIGKQVRMVGPDQADGPVATVVGLVEDIHFREHRKATPMIIRPYRQGGLAQGAFLVRSGPEVPSFSALRDAIRSVDPNTTLVESNTMDELILPEIAQPRLNAWLLSGFAVVAVLLAAIGLYGIMASAVSQQTRELGIRLALGATPGRLQHMVVVQALKVAVVGTVAGLLAAWAGSKLLTSMLFEVTPNDPVTLAGVSALLLAVALFAAYLPARRASRIDPARVLRSE